MIKDISLVGDVIGASVVNEKTGEAEIKTLRRQAAGHAGTWTEIATIVINNVYTYAGIDFYVSRIAANGGLGGPTGILHVSLMSNSNLTGIQLYSFSWEYANNVVPENFVFAYKLEDNKVYCSILFYGENNDKQVTFNVLTERNVWDLPGTKLTEIPSDYTQIPSTLATIQNPCTTLSDFNFKQVSIPINKTGIRLKPHGDRGCLFMMFNPNGGSYTTSYMVGFNGYASTKMTSNRIGTDTSHAPVYNEELKTISKERTGGGLNKGAISSAPLFNPLSVFPN